MEKFNIDEIKNVIVHPGLFHADDVMCVSLLQNLNPNIEVIRTRDQDLIAQYAAKGDTIVCDVGLEYNKDMLLFDHHQQDCPVREDGYKMASCGMLYDYLVETGVLHFDEKLNNEIHQIERGDNGEAKERDSDLLSIYVSCLNPLWDEKLNSQECFNKAIDGVRSYLETGSSKEIEQSILDRGNAKQLSDANAQKELNDSLFQESVLNGYVISEHYIPYESFYCDKNVNFFIFEASTHDQVNLMAIPPEPGSYEQKITIPEDIKDKVSFRHNAGFMAAVKFSTPEEKEQAYKTCESIAKDLTERNQTQLQSQAEAQSK